MGWLIWSGGGGAWFLLRLRIGSANQNFDVLKYIWLFITIWAHPNISAKHKDIDFKLSADLVLGTQRWSVMSILNKLINLTQIVETMSIVKEMILKSKVDFTDLDWQEVSKYITKEMEEARVSQHFP